VAHLGLGGADVLGDPMEQLIRSLNDDAVVARQIASAKHRKSIVGERRQHIRTVRSAAWSRNHPRPRLAWLLLLILLVLIALVAKANAAPEDDAIALAVRYADILTGVDREDDVDGVLDERAEDGEDGEDAEDGEGAERGEDAERGERGEDAEDAEGADDAWDAELAGLAGGSDGADVASFDSGLEAREPLAAGNEDGEAGSDHGGDEGDGTEGNPGQLAMLDAEQAPAGATTGDDASFASASAGAEETYESWMRHRRPSRWGRLDVGVAWRRSWRTPMHAPAYRSNEVWLLATWRR
jgi:hypothetical protein